MRKLNLDSEEVVRQIVNYALREYDVDYECVKKHHKINGIPWFQYYWDTPETKKEFLDWLKNFLKTSVNYKPYAVDEVVNSINLNLGLKVYESDIKK